jgi:PiT family inorganic phosphate transporter
VVDDVILIVVVLAFAWNLGVHYTGAVMGMPYAARAIALPSALILIATMTILGATFASGGVEETVGRHIIADRSVTVPDAIVVVLAAGLLTTLYNYWRIPTSTIQILVFCLVGMGLGANIAIHWETIGRLALVWVSAPLAAMVLGFLFTRLLDRIVPPDLSQAQGQRQPASSIAAPMVAQKLSSVTAQEFRGITGTMPSSEQGSRRRTQAALRLLPMLLVLVGAFASFALGANDVANATGALILTHRFSLTIAGLIGGLAMALGTLTWGRRILHMVAFDVVKMDLAMASAAQGVQALVVLLAVTQGYFTSMNQALIGAMAGAGLARGRETVQRQQVLAILRGWLIGPLSGLAVAYALEWLVRALLR